MSIFNFDSSNDNYDYLNGFDSAELTFKNMTLKDALFKAFEQLDAIPRMKLVDGELVLDVDYVNKLRDLIDDETLPPLEWNKQQDNYQYATEMESDLLNATNLSDDQEAVEIYPAKGAYASLRSSDFVFNSLNSYIELPKRINYVNKLYGWLGGLIVTNGTKVYYKYDNKTYFVDTVTSLPTPSTDYIGLYYATIDTQILYQVDSLGTVWNNVGTPDLVYPKMRFVDTFSNFDSTNYTGSPRQLVDYFIAQDTGNVYIYRSGSYQIINSIDSNGNLLINLTPRLFEKQRYDTFDAETPLGTTGDRSDPNKYFQTNTIYYDYRQNKIQVGRTTGLFDTVDVLGVVFDIALDNYVFEDMNDDNIFDVGETANTISVTNTTSDKFEALFQVWYTPIPVSIRASVDRQDLSDVDRYSQIMDNQGARIIELANVMDNMQGKINRIGNTELELDYRATSIGDLYENGDYTNEGYVITNTELIYYQDYIYAKHQLSKNYNMLSKFLGVQSEVRQYEMGEQDTLERKLMYSEYVEVDVNTNATAPSGFNTSKMIQEDGKNAWLSTFDTSLERIPVAGAMFKTDESDDWLLTGFSSNGSGNTLIFDMQLDSNKSAGETLETEESGIWTVAQVAKGFAQYTDDSGKCNEFQIKLFDRLVAGLPLQANMFTVANDYPKTDDSLICNTYIGNADAGKFEIAKDNREKIGMTYSLKSYATDYNKIIFGKKLQRRNALVTFNQPTTIKVYTYDSELFDKTTTRQAPSGYLNNATATLNINYTNNTIQVQNTIIGSAKAWCLTDEDDNILIAVNQGDSTLDTFTFNFRNKRSDINYFY